MNIQELRAKIVGSKISAEIKQEILALLDSRVTMDVIEQIKDLIQKDIDNDTSSILTKDDTAEALKANVELGNGMSKIEETLKEDMSFVETEMKDINDLVQKMGKAIDEAKAEDIRASLPKA